MFSYLLLDYWSQICCDSWYLAGILNLIFAYLGSFRVACSGFGLNSGACHALKGDCVFIVEQTIEGRYVSPPI